MSHKRRPIYDDDEDDYYDNNNVDPDEDEDYQDDDEDDFQEDEDELEEEIKKELQSVPFGMLMDMKQKQNEKQQQLKHQQQREREQERIQKQQQQLKNDKNQSSMKKLKLSSKYGKREDKDAPLETTAKVPVSRFKQVVTTKKMVSRDPRFDSLGGKFDEKFYREKYGFLDNIMKKDIGKLTERLKETTDVDLQAKIQKEIQSKRSKMASQELQDKRRKLKEEWEKQEIENVKQGKKPFYLKQAAFKDMEIKEKYKQLKSKNQLDKFMEKRRQKISSKSKVNLPRTRRSASDD